MIIGCGGSGKTTLATLIGEKLQQPVIYLDQHFWTPGWVPVPPERWSKLVSELAAGKSWVMDGNYGGTMELRLEKADTIIFLYLSRWLCLYRILKRTLKYYGKVRPRMAKGCPERFSLEFIHYVMSYNDSRAPKILNRLLELKDEKKIYVLKSRKAVSNFMKSI